MCLLASSLCWSSSSSITCTSALGQSERQASAPPVSMSTSPSTNSVPFRLDSWPTKSLVRPQRAVPHPVPMHSLHTAGNYLTQVFSVFLATCGIFLLAFSTWQFGISEPECCYIVAGGNSQVVSGNLGEQQNWSGNCSELHKGVLLGSADLHMTPGVTMALALLGLLVRDTL